MNTGTNGITEWATDYWHFIIALITGAGGIWLGAERTKWKLQQVVADSEKHELRCAHLEERVRLNEATLARLEASQVQGQAAILRNLEDIKEALKSKVDKQ